jgi:thiol-disulfide isomerase/thioredoxin
VLDYFNGLEEPVNLAVFTSDWCGDAMSTTPAVLRLADASDNIRLSVFNRDDELELANSFLPEHRAGTVPVFVVFDGEMGEIARFIETARSLVPTIDAMDEMVAQAAASVADEGERRQQTRGRRTAHRVSKAGEWGAVILNEFQQLVADGMARSSVDRPAEGGTQWPPQE